MAGMWDDWTPDTDLPLGEGVFRVLCDALRGGDLKPGDRLREEELAKLLKVSRTPVREALNRLVQKGLAEAAGGRGLIVRRLSQSEVLELYTMREILEGAAAALAAQHASQPEIDAMFDLERRFEAAAGDPAEMARINRMFHEAIFGVARNRYLNAALAELQDAIALLGRTTFTVEGRGGPAGDEHQAILAAIAGHDLAAAEQAARAHIRGALRARLHLMHE